MFAKRSEPIKVFVALDVAVVFFPDKSERRAHDDKVDGLGLEADM